jgi:hypothetical protein
MERGADLPMANTICTTEPVQQPAEGPLNAAHHRELALAHSRAKAVRNAAAVAAFNGWATAILALLSAPFALFGASGLVTTIVLTAVAANEFRGRRRLLRFDPSAATLLGWNQLGLLGMITAYCLWALYTGLYGTNSVTVQLQAFSQLDSALGSAEGVDTLVRQITILIYGTVIALSALFQGLNAVYYFTRRKYVTAYVAETPEWVRELRQTTT